MSGSIPTAVVRMRPLIKPTNNTDKTQKIKTKMQNSKDTRFFLSLQTLLLAYFHSVL